MTNLQAVLFDLDGTLIDSEYYYFLCWSPVLKRNFDIDIDYDDWLKYFAGHTDISNYATLRNQWNVIVDEEFLQKEIVQSYIDRPMTSIPLMPYAKEILELLKDQNIKIALVTSSPTAVVDLILGHHDLLHYFDFFITRDQVTYTKPNPEPYLKAIDILNLPKESIIAVEDTSIGYSSATAAGLACYVITEQETQKQKLPVATNVLKSLNELENEMMW